MMKCTIGFLALLCLMAGAAHAAGLFIGADANYSLGMERDGMEWRWDDGRTNLFDGMAANGIRGFRVRLWMGEDGDNGRRYAAEVVTRALQAGMDPYLVIFLSEDWADMMKQPLPEVWKDLSFEERLDAVRAYSKEIVEYFRALGLTSHLYEIGNEIDYGICGEYPSKSAKKTPESLSRRLWPRSAEIIRASQEGVLAADPDAKFMLHISHWWDLDFCTAFFRFMQDQGLQLDYAGLSYFPTANIGGSLDMAEFAAVVTRLFTAIRTPLIIAEAAYPSTRDFRGQFSRWKYDVMGYPLTLEGQQRWLADFLALCQQLPAIYSVYYWSPEWAGEGMWKGFALFEPDGQAKPAWTSFAQKQWQNRRPPDFTFMELRRGQLFPIPVDAAKKEMIETVQRLKTQTDGVNVEHIALLDQTPLRVGAYNIRLRSSLQHNMILELADDAVGRPVEDILQAAAAAPKPPVLPQFAQTLVLVARPDDRAAAEEIQAHLQETGQDVVLHIKADDAPIRFGMCGAFTDGTSTAGGMY